MTSKSERDRIRKWRLWLTWVLVACSGFQFWYEFVREKYKNPLLNTLGDIVPNIIAAALVALVVSVWVSDNSRQRYLEAIRSVRMVLRNERAKNEISEATTRKIMVSVVRQMSDLYFDKDQPYISPEDIRTLSGARCGTCMGKSQMVSGRCNECFDVSDAWIEQDPRPQVIS